MADRTGPCEVYAGHVMADRAGPCDGTPGGHTCARWDDTPAPIDASDQRPAVMERWPRGGTITALLHMQVGSLLDCLALRAKSVSLCIDTSLFLCNVEEEAFVIHMNAIHA